MVLAPGASIRINTVWYVLLHNCSLDDKLDTFLEELPNLISNKNILWDVGIYSGMTNDQIESIIADNPRDINMAGRKVKGHTFLFVC